jgi:hypothetical protein
MAQREQKSDGSHPSCYDRRNYFDLSKKILSSRQNLYFMVLGALNKNKTENPSGP